MTEAMAGTAPTWGVQLDEQELTETVGGGWALLIGAILALSAAVGVVDVILFGGCTCRDSGDAL